MERERERKGGTELNLGISKKKFPLFGMMARSHEVFAHVLYVSVSQPVGCNPPILIGSRLCGQFSF